MLSLRRTVIVPLVFLAAASFSAPAVASGGGGGTSGGTPALTLPTTFPASVPLPAGQLFGVSTTVPGRWSVGLVVRGGYPEVMQAVDALYISHGFLPPAGQTQPFEYLSDAYDIAVVGENRDHSATKTNVTVVVATR